MPRVTVLFFRDVSGIVPAVDWVRGLPPKARAKCRARIERLGEMGFDLRRPEADFLRDGIYELRASLGGVHDRMLYFFLGRSAVVVSHGLVKERLVPPREIDLAILRMALVKRDPLRHTSEDR